MMKNATAEKPTAPKTSRELALELIALMRAERRVPPAGDIADPALQVELIENLIERGVQYERERAPQPQTRYDLDSGRHVHVGPVQRVRLRDNPVLAGLAKWCGYLQDRLAGK